MRIAVNAAFLSQKRFGIATHSEAVIAGLAAHAGFHLDLYSGAHSPHDFPNVTLHPTSPRLQAQHGSTANLLRFAWLQTVLPLSLRSNRPDLFLSLNFEGMLFPSAPQALYIYDLIPLFYPQETPRWTHYFRYVVPRLIKASRKVLTISEYTKNDIVKHYQVDPEKVIVTYPGVHQTYFTDKALPPPDNLGRYFVFVGTFAHRKNLETVIRALAKIADKVSENLAIVAYWDEVKGPEIKALAAHLGIAERLKFLSGLSLDQLAGLYQNAAASVLLSEYEGFGYPAAEAMACGTPVIVSDSTSLAEIVGDAGVKVPSRDVDAAALAMLSIATDPAQREQLSKNSRGQAAKFTRQRSWNAVNDAVELAARS